MGLLWLKSNLNLSGDTNDPFCVTCLPNVLLNDSCNKWVAEWLALELFLFKTSISKFTFCPIDIDPFSIFP